MPYSGKNHNGIDSTMPLNMPPASRESSAPPSPTAMRTLQGSISNFSDERTPLLPSAGRSRIRLNCAAEINRLSTKPSQFVSVIYEEVDIIAAPDPGASV
ncbi:hypothetical protein DID88_003737 [Monilinia fructigena]|uniref:Uncharacterized protein n=1 Tax=Monilinia fructigena TaxID=38457 RepID=A0A395ITR5_9HELO|nr:hypothetical protein DID88_003737 [Monilinia fructigena]